jgi:hypothetical protein
VVFPAVDLDQVAAVRTMRRVFVRMVVIVMIRVVAGRSAGLIAGGPIRLPAADGCRSPENECRRGKKCKPLHDGLLKGTRNSSPLLYRKPGSLARLLHCRAAFTRPFKRNCDAPCDHRDERK